jgi:hypothetical protein
VDGFRRPNTTQIGQLQLLIVQSAVRLESAILRRLIVVAYDRADSVLHAMTVLRQLTDKMRTQILLDAPLESVLHMAGHEGTTHMKGLTLSLRVVAVILETLSPFWLSRR